MDLTLLKPSTWYIGTAIGNLLGADPNASSRGLSDTFILITLYMALLSGCWVVYQTIISVKRSGQYLKMLKSGSASIDAVLSTDLPLFREFKRYIIEIPSRDGSDRNLLRRTVDACEVFRDSVLSPSFTTSRLIQAIPGILTGIGVLGTFVGLQIGIGGLDLKDLKKLETSIVPLIQGCAVAFSTSVWGVLSSLAFSGLEKGLESWVQRRVRTVQSLVDRLVKRYVPEEALAELERTALGTEDVIKGLAVAIGDEMQKAIGRLGQEIKESVANATFEGHGQMMEKSAELMANAITTELAKLRDQIGSMSDSFTKEFSGASSQLQNSISNFEPTVKELTETVGVAQNTVKEAVDKLHAHEAVMEKMALAATEVRQAAEAFKEMQETLKLSSARNESAASAQLTAAQSNEKVAEKFDHVGDRLPEIRQTLENAASVIASIGGPIVELKTYLERLPDDQQAIAEKRDESEARRNSELLKMTGDLAEKVGQAAEQFEQIGGMAEGLGTAALRLENASNELAKLGNHISEASKAQQNNSDMLLTAALAGERTAKALEPLPLSFHDLTHGLELAGASVAKGAEKAGKSYGELVALQQQWFSGAEVGLKAVENQLQSIISAYGDQVEVQTRGLMNQWTKAVIDCLKTYEAQVSQIQADMDTIQEYLSKWKSNN